MTKPTKKQETPEVAGERARDEQRAGGGPRYGGEGWDAADQRKPEERFGHARNDDADPLELAKNDPDASDDERPGTAGMGRGEQPRKSKQREG